MLSFLWAGKPAKPAVIPTDTIVPVHYFDDNAINRSVLLYMTLRFDHVLDPDRLHRSLERLMELGDWRKLGSRLRMTVRPYLVHGAVEAGRELTSPPCRTTASSSTTYPPRSTRRDRASYIRLIDTVRAYEITQPPPATQSQQPRPRKTETTKTTSNSPAGRTGPRSSMISSTRTNLSSPCTLYPSRTRRWSLCRGLTPIWMPWP